VTKLLVVNLSGREENIFTGKSITSIAVNGVKYEFDPTDECDQHTAGLMRERHIKGMVITGDTGVSERWENPTFAGKLVGYVLTSDGFTELVYRMRDGQYYDGYCTRLSSRAIPHITFSNS
jgi:hypothetical protein